MLPVKYLRGICLFQYFVEEHKVFDIIEHIHLLEICVQAVTRVWDIPVTKKTKIAALPVFTVWHSEPDNNMVYYTIL